MKLDQAIEIGRLDAHDQAALVRRGELSGAELVETAIQRIEALDGALASVSWRAFDQARARAAALPKDAPMAGVPWLVKDSLDYPEQPSRAGSRSRDLRPATGAYPFAQTWDAAGLVAVGKSAMPEFGLLPTTEPLSAAATRNPWSLGYSPGGSSGGAGAALAAGLVPLAHGSDGAGSIRIPASCCGVVGLKPGRGATVRARARSLVEDLLVGDSLMSRSVRDVSWAFAASHVDPAHLAPPPGRRLRIALSVEGLHPGPVHPEARAAAEAAAELCASLGHEVEAAAPVFDRPAALEAMHVLWALDAAEAAAAVRASGQDPSAVLEPWTCALEARAEHVSPLQLEAALRVAAELPHPLAAFHARYDVMLTPTLTAPPPRLGEITGAKPADELFERMFGWLSFTILQNLAGTPAISLPLAWSPQGLPVGVMFAAARGGELLLLDLARELEAAAPWAGRWPQGASHAAAAG
ncbi:amidase family protein [Phenylobacterium deserti]|uniref:amidase family protein n=1 Tax=Phenylobacterium deserti TaxID=1914756 RepID=UPI00140384E9|nr:amidase family protein [Phenylobacterium deserti]